jgi:Zn-dependent protease
MPYYERDWYRGEGAGPSSGGPINRSFFLFRVFGIAVEIHLLFLLFLAAELLHGAFERSLPFTGQWLAVLWVSVLLHEFGHCAGARMTGGTAERILMWPLGGLAFVAPPHRAGAQLITTLAGPAVNLLLMLVAGGATWALHGNPRLIPLNPLDPFIPLDLDARRFAAFSPEDWLRVVWGVNYILFLFNVCVPAFPMDGGRIVHELLWFRLGYQRAGQWAVQLGFFVALAVGVFGIVAQRWRLLAIAVFCYLECLQMQQILAAAPAEPEPWEESLQPDPPPKLRVRRPWFWQRWRQAREQREEEQADRILEKIHREGIDSLTRRERRILRRATERRRREPGGA